MSALDFLVANAAEIWSVPPVAIRGERRTARVVEARQAVMYVAIEQLGMKYTRVALYLNRDHTTVMAAVRRFPKRIADDAACLAKVEQLSAAALNVPMDVKTACDMLIDRMARGLRNIAMKDPARLRELIREINNAA
jgi:hypothetical protein